MWARDVAPPAQPHHPGIHPGSDCPVKGWRDGLVAQRTTGGAPPQPSPSRRVVTGPHWLTVDGVQRYRLQYEHHRVGTEELSTSRTVSCSGEGLVVGGGRVVPSRRRTGPKLRRLNRYRVLVVDEVGYLPFGTASAALFFQLVASSYATGSIVLTSNLSFAGAKPTAMTSWLPRPSTASSPTSSRWTVTPTEPGPIAPDQHQQRPSKPTRKHRPEPGGGQPSIGNRGQSWPGVDKYGAPGPGSPWGCGPGRFALRCGRRRFSGSP